MSNHDKSDDNHFDRFQTEDDTTTDETIDFALPPIPSRQHQQLDRGLKIAAYFAGSRGHQLLFQPLGVTVFQCGVTARRDVHDRISDKRKRRYGSILADPADHEHDAVELPLGGDIFMVAIDYDMLKGVAVPSGLRIVDGIVEFVVRPGTTIEDVDKRMSRALRHRNVNEFLGTEDGQRRMIEAGHNPRHRLMTRYRDIGRDTRLSLAEELFLIRPRKELQGLLDLIAEVLADILVK